MEEAVTNLEKSVEDTDRKLEGMAWKIDEFERTISEPNASEEVTVFQLLETVTEVKNDYQNLRKDILEVQALQKQLALNLRLQVKQVQGTFTMLKGKLVGPPV